MISPSSKRVDRTSWHYLPAEIRIQILEALAKDPSHLASCASVSREWQTIIERRHFARIKLTRSRLDEFGYMTRRNRALVHYIWLCLELHDYDCSKCASDDVNTWPMDYEDSTLVVSSIEKLFSALSTWDPNGKLLLDISVHSPSDSQHWFEGLTIMPDTPFDECNENGYRDQSKPADFGDEKHDWIAAGSYPFSARYAIDKIFEEIMDEGPFHDDEEEYQWWQQLPSIPAVTGILLRRQNRRRWKPKALAQMFARFPNLDEIHYEPWREWRDYLQGVTDRASISLFESLASSELRRFIVFENFNQHYLRYYGEPESLRVPNSQVAQIFARSSLNWQEISVSFIIDASHFFDARLPSWKWSRLSSLCLTSRRLAPEESRTEVDDMLKAAAAAAAKMPCLTTMEVWNGRSGLAALFRYQLDRTGRRAVITWRGTWNLTLQPSLIRAWEDVVLRQCGGRGCIDVEKDILDVGVAIRSHGDAIQHLKLCQTVIRPVSLWQMQTEPGQERN